MRMHRFVIVFACALLAACGADKTAANGAQGEDVLPKPATAGRSVTGMPDPGTPGVQPMPATEQAPDIEELPDDIGDDDTVATDDPALQEPALPTDAAPDVQMPPETGDATTAPVGDAAPIEPKPAQP